jgi:chromosome segregation ATPase
MKRAWASQAGVEGQAPTASREHGPEDAAGELKRARLANGYLRARLATLEQAQRTLEERSTELESALRRVAGELSAAREELVAERARRDRAEHELETGHADARERAELAAAGWRVERQRRVQAEVFAVRFEAMREEHHTAVSAELDRLMELVGRWRATATSEAAEASDEPEASAKQPRRGASRRRLRIRSPRPGPAPEEASPAGVLLARALELAAGEVEAQAAAYQLVGLADGDRQAVQDAIARADKVMWQSSGAVPEGQGSEADAGVEVAGRMPVLVAGASSLLSAALQHMRAT